MKILFLSVCVVFCLSTSGLAFSLEFPIEPYNGSSIRFSNLSSITDVESNVKKTIKGISRGDSLSVERLLASEWFAVSVDGKSYLTEPLAENWLRTDFNGFYSFSNGIKEISVSNSTRESFIYLSSYLESIKEFLPSYGPAEYKEKVFAFVDVTCPHCKKFHLTERAKFEARGIKIIYVPFSRDASRKSAIDANMAAFCSPDILTTKSNLDNVYMLSKLEMSSKSWFPKCTKIQQSIFSFLIGNGERYSLRGSPMFLTELGDALYGSAALSHYLESK